MRFYISLAVIAGILYTTPGYAADKWALLIGVGDYIHGTRFDLKGPVNDVRMMEELLLTKFGYEATNIRKLVNWDATKANIVDGVENWLASVAKPEDTVVLYYSGHGSQILDLSGDESDNRDEVLCPADIEYGSRGNEISDDELNTMFAKIKASDVTVIFDACHAGTGTRGLDFSTGASNRPMEYRVLDLGYPEPESGDTRHIDLTGKFDGMDFPGGGGQAGDSRSLTGTLSGQQFTMIASCAPDETSASTVFGEGLTRLWAGALTYNLVQALKKADGETTYDQVMSNVLRDVKKINRSQTPQLEGDGSRRIFSNTAGVTQTRSYIRLTKVHGNVVEMKGNTFDELPGSIYRVLSPKTGEPVGRVKVTRAIGLLLDGEIMEGEGEIVAPALAMREFHATSDEKLHVRVGDFGEPTIHKAMKKNLERVGYVWVATSDTAYKDITLTGEIDGSVISLLAGYEITAWLEEGGVKSRSVTSRNVDEIMAVMRPLLENAYAIKKLTRMDNDSPPFKVSVWATNSADPGISESKFAEMNVGDPVYFHFESSKNAYLTLLNVGAEGEITILFPNEYMPFNRVVANKTYTLPTPEMGFDLHLGGPPGQELVKAFATEFPLDLSTLNTKAVGGFRTLDFDMAWEKHSPSVVDGLVSTINTSFNNNMSEGTRAIMLSANKEEKPPVGTPTGNWSTDYLIIDAR